MKLAASVVAWLALATLLMAPVAVFLDTISLDTCKHAMLAGTILWFAASPIAMKRRAG